MTSSRRPIFRSEAVHRYIQNHEAAVMPRLVCPRTFLFLWILLGLVLVAGCVLAGVVRERLTITSSAVHMLPSSDR